MNKLDLVRISLVKDKTLYSESVIKSPVTAIDIMVDEFTI